MEMDSVPTLSQSFTALLDPIDQLLLSDLWDCFPMNDDQPTVEDSSSPSIGSSDQPPFNPATSVASSPTIMYKDEEVNTNFLQPMPKVAFRTKSEIDVMDDGYKWRKYGKKSVKESPTPRNYYKCSNEGCPVKKRIQRDREDPEYIITTYHGVHNHHIPNIVYFHNHQDWDHTSHMVSFDS